MPPLRDLTGGRATVPVEVQASRWYELLSAAWVVSDKELASGQSVGSDLLDLVAGALDPTERARVERFGTASGALWLALFATVAELAADATFDDLEARVRADGAVRLRHQILSMVPRESDDDLEAAAAGDGKALDRLERHASSRHPGKASHLEQLRKLTELGDRELVEGALAALGDLNRAFSDHLDRVEQALHRDAQAARGLTMTMPADAVVEAVTHGIEYNLRPGIDSIRLVPAAVVRPWSLMLDDGSTQVFVYPLGEEYLDSDPDEPPTWLVSTYKALGDEKRLRILRRLAEGPATLGDLVEHLALAKSTVHHHIGILRSAGLVRVAVGDNKEPTTYSIREKVLPETERLLAAYLTDHQKGET